MAVDWTPKAMLQMQMIYRGSAKDIGDAGDMGKTRWMLWRRATVRRCAFKRAIFDIFCCSKKLNYPITYLQLISDIVIFVQKKDVKIQPTNQHLQHNSLSVVRQYIETNQQWKMETTKILSSVEL